MDADADKTGTDINSDSVAKRKDENKFDKPAREQNPDSTGIDIDADKTERENTTNE